MNNPEAKTYSVPIEKKKRKKQIAIFGIMSLLAVVVCLAVVLGVAFSLMTEGVYEFENEPLPSKTEQPVGNENILSFLDTLADSAVDGTLVSVDTRISAWVDDDSIEYDGSDGEKAALVYLKQKLLDSVDKLYPEDRNGSFDDGFTDYTLLSIDKETCVDATCVQGRIDDYGKTVEDDYYFFELTLDAGEAVPQEGSGLYNTFRLYQDKVAAEGVVSELSSVCDVTALSIVPGEYKISAKSNRLTDKLSNLDLIRTYTVSVKLDFKGDFESLGSKNVTFVYNVGEYNTYRWTGITFNLDEVYLSEGSETSVSVNAVMNDYSDYTIRFESSDESIAVVDEMGYIKGIKNSAEPVTVTVYYSYLGHDYTDTCLVYVTVPVEKIVISYDSLTLKSGEVAQISAELSPADATITDVIWISSDEAIATVSQDGGITAVSQGTASIICVSKDGSFRDSCTLTVTE